MVFLYKFRNEYKKICQKNIKLNEDGEMILKDKKKKTRRKNISIEINNDV